MKKYSGYIFLSIIFLLLLLLLYCYCRHRERRCPLTVTHWISWNIFFNPAPISGQRQNDIQGFEDYLTNYVHAIDPTAIITFHVNYCPCDTLLTNLDATLLTGSGNSIQPPPSTPNPKPSGDYILASNIEMSIPDLKDKDSVNVFKSSGDTSLLLVAPTGNTRRKLAVIDTGLDTMTFHNAYPQAVWNGNLLWQDPFKATLFNVVPDELNRLMDDNPVKHGTAATSIVLQEINLLNSSVIPQIMVIRAFDGAERGSIYTASCALSYAIQQHADFINASWGYYGKEDEVLKYYITKADRQNIHILAAAGNTPGHHIDDVCLPQVNHQNDLNRLKPLDSLFYPACFAYLPNLVSVTQLNQVSSLPIHPIIPCYYQNFSQDFITVGVLNNSRVDNICCRFNIPFLANPIEGSSFATPVMTAIAMSSPEILGGMAIKQYIQTTAHQTAPAKFTYQGKYFIYPKNN